MNTSVVHMHDQRNEKNGLFLRLNVILENWGKGSKCAYFQEKGSFLDSIRGSKRGHFFNVLKNLDDGIKSSAKIV